MTDATASDQPPARARRLFAGAVSVHNAVFSRIDAALSGWALPTLARFAFEEHHRPVSSQSARV